MRKINSIKFTLITSRSNAVLKQKVTITICTIIMKMQTLNLNNIWMRNENFVDSKIPYLSSIERNFCNLLYNQEKFSQRNINTKQNSINKS